MMTNPSSKSDETATTPPRVHPVPTADAAPYAVTEVRPAPGAVKPGATARARRGGVTAAMGSPPPNNGQVRDPSSAGAANGTAPHTTTGQKPAKKGHQAGFFGEIYETVRSILIGMRITAKYWFSPVVTVRYPYEKLSFAPRFRGIHEFEADMCIACEACAKACPVDCIYIDKSGPRKLDKKTGEVKGGELWRYAIDYEKCMFCSLCVEVCPTECIHMGKNHDISGYRREDMIVEFAELAKDGLKTPIPLWMERNADRLPWVKAEKDRIERGELAKYEPRGA
ncbi:MAG: 4Fe-4S binding protein [Planctomycetota bacterium]